MVLDCGISHDFYHVKESQTSAGALVDTVHVCARCVGYGYTLDSCATPTRVEGNCGACGQYGHVHRLCPTVAHVLRPQPQANVAYSGVAFSGDRGDGEGEFVYIIGDIGGRYGQGTTSDVVWVKRQDSEIYSMDSVALPRMRVAVIVTT